MQGFQRTVAQLNYDASRPAETDTRLNLGSASETITVEAQSATVQTETAQVGKKRKASHKDREDKIAPPSPDQGASSNVTNLQRRVSGVLPVRIDVPRTGTSYRFVRPLVLDEETKVSFTYKSK